MTQDLTKRFSCFIIDSQFETVFGFHPSPLPDVPRWRLPFPGDGVHFAASILCRSMNSMMSFTE